MGYRSLLVMIVLGLLTGCSTETEPLLPPTPEPTPEPENVWAKTGFPFDGTIQDILTIGEDFVFVATWGGGLFRSIDSGKTWVSVAPVIGEDVIALARAADGAILMGTPDFDALYRSSDGGDSWRAVGSVPSGIPEDIFSNALGELLASIFYHGVMYSSDNGTSWAQLATPPDDRLLSALITADGSFLAGANSGVYISTDRGSSWEMKRGSAGGFLAISMEGTVYASGGPFVWISTDNGRNWIHSDILSALGVGPIVCGRNEGLYAGTWGDGVFTSGDKGVTWTPLTGGLDVPSIRSLAVTPAGYLYAGTWLGGLYKSTRPINPGFSLSLETSQSPR
jgi:photosystem II stability/assembly factor-like uncharacterized protein